MKRAKDFHKKEDIIKGLHRKADVRSRNYLRCSTSAELASLFSVALPCGWQAYFKNEDEFAYGMMSHSTMKVRGLPRAVSDSTG